METEYILISRPDHENMAIKLNINMYKNYLFRSSNNVYDQISLVTLFKL